LKNKNYTGTHFPEKSTSTEFKKNPILQTEPSQTPGATTELCQKRIDYVASRVFNKKRMGIAALLVLK